MRIGKSDFYHITTETEDLRRWDLRSRRYRYWRWIIFLDLVFDEIFRIGCIDGGYSWIIYWFYFSYFSYYCFSVAFEFTVEIFPWATRSSEISMAYESRGDHLLPDT